MNELEHQSRHTPPGAPALTWAPIVSDNRAWQMGIRDGGEFTAVLAMVSRCANSCWFWSTDKAKGYEPNRLSAMKAAENSLFR